MNKYFFLQMLHSDTTRSKTKVIWNQWKGMRLMAPASIFTDLQHIFYPSCLSNKGYSIWSPEDAEWNISPTPSHFFFAAPYHLFFMTLSPILFWGTTPPKFYGSQLLNDNCYHLRIGSYRATPYTGNFWFPFCPQDLKWNSPNCYRNIFTFNTGVFILTFIWVVFR